MRWWEGPASTPLPPPWLVWKGEVCPPLIHLGCSSLSWSRSHTPPMAPAPTSAPQRGTRAGMGAGSSHLHRAHSNLLAAAAGLYHEVAPGTSLWLQCLQLPSSPWISSSPFS